MNDGILTQTQTPPAMPYGLLGRPSPMPMPAGPASFDPRSLPGLVAYWPFDEDASLSNAIALDVSGNGFHLTSSGALSNPGINGGGRLLSAFGTQWNPSSARLSRGLWNTTPQWDANATGWSVAFWLFTDLTNNTQGTSSTAASINFSTITSAGAESVRFGSGTPALGFPTISSRCYFTDGSFVTYQTGVNLLGGMTSITPQGQWTHMAFVADPTTRRYTMYVNGAPQTPLLYASDKVLSSFSSGLPCLMQWPGAIDEAAVYSRALTASEIQRLAGVPLAPVSASTLHPECRSWISRVLSNGGSVNTATASAVNAFCQAIEAAGIRDRFFRLNLFCGDNLAAALVPLYRGQSLGGTQFGNATDTNANFVAGDYVETGATGGLLGNGSNKWLNTGLPLNFNTNRHIGVVLQNSGGAGGYLLGAWGASGNASILGIFTESNLSLSGFNFSDAAASGSAGFNAPTLRRSAILSSTPGTGGLQMFINGSAGSTGTAYSTSNTGPISIFGLRRSNAATPEFITSARLSAYTIGDSLNASQAAALNTALTAFSTAMSRA